MAEKERKRDGMVLSGGPPGGPGGAGGPRY